jgi:hypothetical protein
MVPGGTLLPGGIGTMGWDAVGGGHTPGGGVGKPWSGLSMLMP